MGQRTMRPQAIGDAAARLALRCWGSLALVDEARGAALTPRGRKARALLAFLARQNGAPVPRERLAGLLWGERGEDQARASLRQALRELRLAAPALAIVANRLDLRLAPDALTTDIAESERLAAAGQAAALAERLAGQDALLFADLDGIDPGFDDWLRGERMAASERRIESALDAGERALAAGEAGAAARLAHALERLDPADERIARFGMRAELALGEAGAAHARYARLAEAMAHALGAAPAPATRALLDNTAPASPPVAAPEAAAHTRAGPRPRRLRPMIAGAAALALLAAGVAFGPIRAPEPRPAAIAVLPFRAVSPGSAAFAEGLTEEITTRLARDPALRIAGRTSAAAFSDQALDARAIGRGLRVGHLLEGSVRQQGARVRVAVRLVDTRDGMRRWAQSYDGEIGDVLAIQDRLGADVARQLSRRLAAPVAPAPRRGVGQAHALYLTARGLIATRDPASVRTANGLLRRAVRLAPDYAPGWAALATTSSLLRARIGDPEGRIARAQARRAIALDPRLGYAHAVLGMIEEGRPAARAHLRRAVALDPGDAQAWYWLAVDADRQGRRAEAVMAARRAIATDPFFVRNAYAAAILWSAGLAAEADAYERAIVARHPDPARRLAALARIAARCGDWSGFVLHTDAAARRDSAEVQDAARIDAVYGRARLGLAYGPHLETPITRLWYRLMRGDVPKPLIGAPPLARAASFWQLPDIGAVGARRLVEQGRGAELVALYRESFGTPEAFAAADPGFGFLYFAPLVARALAAGGAEAEAARILALAGARAARVEAGRRDPDIFVTVAAVHAARGERGAARAALGRAAAYGWPRGYRRSPWLPDYRLAETPQFRALAADPVLRALDARVAADHARERGELLTAWRTGARLGRVCAA